MVNWTIPYDVRVNFLDQATTLLAFVHTDRFVNARGLREEEHGSGLRVYGLMNPIAIPPPTP